jgi:hypothetical protein
MCPELSDLLSVAHRQPRIFHAGVDEILQSSIMANVSCARALYFEHFSDCLTWLHFHWQESWSNTSLCLMTCFQCISTSALLPVWSIFAGCLQSLLPFLRWRGDLKTGIKLINAALPCLMLFEDHLAVHHSLCRRFHLSFLDLRELCFVDDLHPVLNERLNASGKHGNLRSDAWACLSKPIDHFTIAHNVGRLCDDIS